MNDYAGAALNHGGKQTAIQPDGGIQILVHGLLPELIRHGDESAAGSGRSSDIVDNNVDAFEPAQHLTDDMRRPFGSRDVRLDEMAAVFSAGADRAVMATVAPPCQKAVRDRLARAFGAAGHQNAFAVEFTPCLSLMQSWTLSIASPSRRLLAFPGRRQGSNGAGFANPF